MKPVQKYSCMQNTLCRQTCEVSQSYQLDQKLHTQTNCCQHTKIRPYTLCHNLCQTGQMLLKYNNSVYQVLKNSVTNKETLTSKSQSQIKPDHHYLQLQKPYMANTEKWGVCIRRKFHYYNHSLVCFLTRFVPFPDAFIV